MKNSFQVQLPVFEGPFDLLLFFIEQQELDIHDIPIAKISAHFFAYLQQVKELELDTAGDFVRVAATLIRIKARMLLPTEAPFEAEEGEDPRAALAEQLLRYKQFRTVAEPLQQLAEKRHKKYARGNLEESYAILEQKYDAESTLQTLSLHKLLQSYRQLYNRHLLQQQSPSKQQIWRYPYSVSRQKKKILERLYKVGRIRFLSLLEEEDTLEEKRLLCIFNLLATLELWQQGKIQVQGTSEYNEFYLLSKKGQ